jgi:hypothetical protein
MFQSFSCITAPMSPPADAVDALTALEVAIVGGLPGPVSTDTFWSLLHSAVLQLQQVRKSRALTHK